MREDGTRASTPGLARADKGAELGARRRGAAEDLAGRRREVLGGPSSCGARRRREAYQLQAAAPRRIQED